MISSTNVRGRRGDFSTARPDIEMLASGRDWKVISSTDVRGRHGDFSTTRPNIEMLASGRDLDFCALRIQQ